jgi:hypothetical protein
MIPAGAQNCLAQPAHAEQQQQNADRDLQDIERNAIKERPERGDDQRQREEPDERAENGGPQATHHRNRKHDGERFDHLDERREKGRGDGRSGMQAEHLTFPFEWSRRAAGGFC